MDEQQSLLAERAFEIAKRAGAKIVRVFSALRVAEPAAVFERVVDVLQDLADKAAQHGLIVGIENDHACNISTAQEMARRAGGDRSCQPAGGVGSGQALISRAKSRFPRVTRCSKPRASRIVHAKDCTLEGHKPVWEPLGEGDIDWQGQIDALAEDGYQGFIHLETYWPGVQTLRAAI